MTAIQPSACPICTFARVHGSWPPSHRGTHCRDCHRSWTAKRAVHCAFRDKAGLRCCAHFASISAANLHWGSGKGNRAPADDADHLDPTEVVALALGSDGTWRMAQERPPRLLGLCGEPRNGLRVPSPSRKPAPEVPYPSSAYDVRTTIPSGSSCWRSPRAADAGYQSSRW